MNSYCRTLITDEEVEYFVDNILKLSSNKKNKRAAINSITAAERNIRDYNYYSTLTHTDNRDFEYRDEGVRIKLRKQILDELIQFKRLENEDNIKLRRGGAAPDSQVKAEKRAFYIIGPPASGKSYIANKIADNFSAYILDSDYAKRKLPEYKNQIGAASLIHEESDAIIFNYSKGNLLNYCINHKYNMVIPKIGHNSESIYEFCKTLKEIGYDVYLISVELDRVKATQRAYNRYKKTKRYVPLSLIFDGYGNQPTLNYFKLKQLKKDVFSGFAQISTDVKLGDPSTLIEQESLSVFQTIFGGKNKWVLKK